MTISIQPVVNIGSPIKELGLSAQDLADAQQRVEKILSRLAATSDGWTIQPLSDAIPATVADNETILWFAPSRAEIELAVVTLNQKIVNRIIVFDYQDEDVLQLLEDVGVPALVRSRTINNWLTDRDRKFFKMGQGHGFYGLKSLFDAQLYDQGLMDIFSSEHYALFYDFEVHDLGRLLEPYVRSLLQYESAVS